MSEAAILCVDDELVILKSLEIELHSAFGDNYLYEFAESADEALEIIDELDEDEVQILIIVSDWLMPGMKGDEFLIEVHKKYPKIVKLMLTGQADEDAVERAKQYANLYRYIPKPWNNQELIGIIRSALSEL
ncbi:MAG TPA: response regulator [Oscillatoriales cyanobacterium M59_W2019_021]|nr:MAG: response regulator [Cyanobacteria bacterium J055]HIK33986.1 response regulator [Oscillatoriales cyanobacterium M4454_W2019_049]HIK50903.1 response regulator [Oscillatoriales cyanobacterium M59_W2019_021]